MKKFTLQVDAILDITFNSFYEFIYNTDRQLIGVVIKMKLKAILQQHGQSLPCVDSL